MDVQTVKKERKQGNKSKKNGYKNGKRKNICSTFAVMQQHSCVQSTTIDLRLCVCMCKKTDKCSRLYSYISQ